MKYPDLIKLLDVKNGISEENNDLNIIDINENDNCSEKLKDKITQMENDIENNNRISGRDYEEDSNRFDMGKAW